MNPRVKNLPIAGCVVLVFAIGLQIVPQAHAFLARRAMRTAVVVSAASESAAKSEAAAASTPAATPAPTPAPAAKPAAGAAPLGTVVSTLPAGCKPYTSGGIEYQHCGSTYYRTAFQGSDLVYVSAQP